MRICVFGAGAVGGHFAVRLSAAGHDVSVVARGEHLAAIRLHGLTLRSGASEIRARVKASDRSADLGAQDLVICTAKTTALAGFAEAAPPLLGPDTPVIFAENGIPWWYAIGLAPSRPRPPDLARLDPGGTLRRTFAPARIIGGVIRSANEVVEPGVVVNNSPQRNTLALGTPDDAAGPRLDALRALLGEAGIGSPPVADIRQAIWLKLILNMTVSILCLICGGPAATVVRDERLSGLFLRLLREAIAIAAAHGIDVGGLDPEQIRRQSGGDHVPSIRQDYERRRPLELESNLLTPIAFGRSAGIDTPSLDAIAAIAARMAADIGQPFPL